MHFEKATKFSKNNPLWSISPKVGDIFFLIFEVFQEYTNFMYYFPQLPRPNCDDI